MANNILELYPIYSGHWNRFSALILFHINTITISFKIQHVAYPQLTMKGKSRLWETKLNYILVNHLIDDLFKFPSFQEESGVLASMQ